jgi:hypothetical protein
VAQPILPDPDLLPSEDLIPDELPSDHDPQVRPVGRSGSTQATVGGRKTPRVSATRSGQGF